jgi:arylsulfatase B
VNALVSGGYLPSSRQGAIVEQFTGIEDFYATFCALAGVDPFDKQAEAVGLPPVDSVNIWPLISGENSTSPRTEIVLGIPTVSSPLSIGDPYLNVQAVIQNDGWKLLVGQTHQNIWTSPHYPNKTTHWPNDPMDCSKGCLYNVFDDPTEHNEVSKSNPSKVAELLARIQYYNSTVFKPNRGNDTGLGCKVQLDKWKGFVGPFLDI